MTFFADELLCAEWDKQLWDDYPGLKGKPAEQWCSHQGWYWQDRLNPDLGAGPFETSEECERDLAEAQLRSSNH
jgi:hypothetical protein